MSGPTPPPARRRAVALTYRPRADRAPKVVAKGAGLLADRITTLAERHGVPLHHDPALAQFLSQLPLGGEIPPRLYRVIAELLVFLRRLEEHSR